MQIRLALVDDNLVLAHTLRDALLAFEDLKNIEVFSTGKSFLDSLKKNVREVRPEVVLMDISMSEKDEGIALARQVHQHFPEVKIVMFTIAEDGDHIFEAFKAGAIGYLLKNEKPDFIHKTILDVAAGGALMSPGVAFKTIRFLVSENSEKTNKPNSDYHLSERELDVLRLVAKGHTYQSISDQLFISLETVKKHMTNVFKKLQVKNKIEAINKSKRLL